MRAAQGTQLTCFTGTKVQTLTFDACCTRTDACKTVDMAFAVLMAARLVTGTQVYLLYWYKSTNTDVLLLLLSSRSAKRLFFAAH
jgi:hypothetical protein